MKVKIVAPSSNLNAGQSVLFFLATKNKPVPAGDEEGRMMPGANFWRQRMSLDLTQSPSCPCLTWKDHPSTSSCPEVILFMPGHLHSEVLQWAHSSRPTFHPVVHQTLNFRQQRLLWPTQEDDVGAFVAAYPFLCQQKPSHRLTKV